MFVWDISPVMLAIGPVQIRYYGLLFAVMMLGGYYLWQWQMLRGGHTQQQAGAAPARLSRQDRRGHQLGA